MRIYLCSIFIFIVTFIYGQHTNHPTTTSNSIIQETNQHSAHAYRIYRGRLKREKDQNVSSNFQKCNFKQYRKSNKERYVIKRTSTADRVGKLRYADYYSVHVKNTTNMKYNCPTELMLIKNLSIDSIYHVAEGQNANKNLKKIFAKGTYGCFPRFILVDNKLDSIKVNDDECIIQLAVAKHDITKKNFEIVDHLELEDFYLSTEDYTNLNGLLQYIPDLHGGIDWPDSNRMLCPEIRILNIFLPNDIQIQTFCEANNPNPPHPTNSTEYHRSH